MRKAMLLAVLAASLSACTDDPVQPGPGPDLSAAARDSLAPVYGLDAPNRIPGEFMVRFRPDVADADRLARQVAAAHGGRVFATWKGMKGFWGRLPEQAIQGLRRHPDVEYIEASVLVPPANVSQNVQFGNWGLDRIDQRSLPLDGWFNYKYTGAGVRVWIVDTGVNLYAADLAGRVDTNYYFTYNGTDPFAPCYDHGTPVAIMAAGTTYGVAKNATINVARVSDDCQEGTMSTGAISSAFNFIADYSPRPAVANGSFGRQCAVWCGTTSEDAIRYAISRGVTVVLSAGNDGINACNYTPARVSQAITVGASDRYDARAVVGGSYPWASNYGSCVDLFAPGVGMSAGYRNFSGTSSAAPLVAGVAATYLQRYPWKSPAGVASEIVTASSTYKLSNIGSGSPNRLLHNKFPVRVSISSSGAVFLGGTATFFADVLHGEEPMSYQWSMYRHDTGEWIDLGTDPSQDVYFDGSQPYHVDISVSVFSPAGSAYSTSTMYVTY